MMVTFVSQCDKKAIKRTRRVLDAFADRIGDNTWQTLITKDGLAAVKKLLRKTASKNTAVACHWIRSRSRSDLVWTIGQKDKFNRQGRVPVNRTKKPLLRADVGSGWDYLSLVKVLAEFSALFHDWGKASVHFQNKLKKGSKQSDPLRHEWISCLFFNEFVLSDNKDVTDIHWLSRIEAGNFDIQNVAEQAKNTDHRAFINLPPLASLISWLILTHHKLPVSKVRSNGGGSSQHGHTLDPRSCFFHQLHSRESMLAAISANLGYANNQDPHFYSKNIAKCFEYKALPSESSLWLSKVKAKAEQLRQHLPQIEHALNNDTWRLILHLARVSLMMGDHLYSSKPKCDKWNKRKQLNLYANTTGKQNSLKQSLDEHLIEVANCASSAARSLPWFASGWDQRTDFSFLKEKSPSAYEWQNKAVSAIERWKKTLPENTDVNSSGFFAVNMASTGKGKTVANPKIMLALSNDSHSLRYVLALGLRSLTLQTGSEYRDKFGKEDAENVSVVIGSKNTKALYDLFQDKHLNDSQERTLDLQGSESLESLLEEETDLDALEHELKHSNLYQLFPENNALNYMRFLYPAITVCTIDHIMGATETIKGGKHILPTLRLLSSDLVIDEVDNFNQLDLCAIQRLVHLVGMLGRKVMISSATITPDIAEGFFNAYRRGYQIHANAHDKPQAIGCGWFDESHAVVSSLPLISVSKPQNQDYQGLHADFVQSRISSILSDEKRKGVKRIGELVDCQMLFDSRQTLNEDEIEQAYFKIIADKAVQMHQRHSYAFDNTPLISFGVIRMSTIGSCIGLFEYLLNCNLEKGIKQGEEGVKPGEGGVEIKVMSYHSRQTMLLRHTQEVYLDKVLKRKEKEGEIPAFLSDSKIKQHIKNCRKPNLIFLLVATPVEEVGRDHDFDWAIIEPSSFASIIQLAGRVLRHRAIYPSQANVGVMQYNLKGIKQGRSSSKQSTGVAFNHPGYENSEYYKLNTHDLAQMRGMESIKKSINAIPRIKPPKELDHKSGLIDLEHQVLADYLTHYETDGPRQIQSWFDGAWWMTGFSQHFFKFRQTSSNVSVWRRWQDEKFQFYGKDRMGEFCIVSESIEDLKEPLNKERLWLTRDFFDELVEVERKTNLSIGQASDRFGEINIAFETEDNLSNLSRRYIYSDQFGLKKERRR